MSFLTVQLTQHAHMRLSAAVTASDASGIFGWVGQIVWGTVSDHQGRKFSLRILAIGWVVAVLAMIFISSPLSAWVIVIGWGIVRNSPVPVMYASIIDPVPDGASSGLGIMIGIVLGLSGLIAAPVAGLLVQHAGFTVHYLLLAFVCLLALVPISMMREP